MKPGIARIYNSIFDIYRIEDSDHLTFLLASGDVIKAADVELLLIGGLPLGVVERQAILKGYSKKLTDQSLTLAKGGLSKNQQKNFGELDRFLKVYRAQADQKQEEKDAEADYLLDFYRRDDDFEEDYCEVSPVTIPEQERDEDGEFHGTWPYDDFGNCLDQPEEDFDQSGPCDDY